MTLGPFELIILLAVVALLFGTRLPKVARSLGQARSEFQKGQKESPSEEASTSADK